MERALEMFSILKVPIPYTTLQGSAKTRIARSPSLGKKAIFTLEDESEMADNVKKLANMYVVLTPVDLRSAAFEFEVKKGFLIISIKQAEWQGGIDLTDSCKGTHHFPFDSLKQLA
ncbi:hypothetical protein PR048_005277 [Dryococelus australis]|uniref:Uncharacterized protein n=1 Tax=Dryococelus australis TaxID=614101 RepID=A0ABQ9I7T3_9NEOP|nr:hypothetical protein PR048_005277 [Dryococelus australis]